MSKRTWEKKNMCEHSYSRRANLIVMIYLPLRLAWHVGTGWKLELQTSLEYGLILDIHLFYFIF